MDIDSKFTFRRNFFKASLVPSASSFELPEWVLRWNSPNVDVNPNSFDGTKTTNLLHVAESMMEAQFSSSQPTLADLNFLIEN